MDEKGEPAGNGDGINAIRRNMVHTRTRLFEGVDVLRDKEKTEQSIESPSPLTENNRPLITAPKPKRPGVSSVSPSKLEDKSTPDTPKQKGAVAKKTVLFKGGNQTKEEEDAKSVDPISTGPNQSGHRRVLSEHDSQKSSLTNEILTESQVVRPKTTANMPIYAQVDKNRKSVGKSRPPKPSIPKIDRMRGKATSDGHRYDGVVLVPVDPLPKPVETVLPTPPSKPPRTFAHDEYLRVKAVKKQQLNAKLNEIAPEENDLQTVPKNETQEGLPKKPVMPATKPPLPKDVTKPPPKPKRPDRPPSLNEKTDKAHFLTSSHQSHMYEEINSSCEQDKANVLTASTDSQGYAVVKDSCIDKKHNANVLTASTDSQGYAVVKDSGIDQKHDMPRTTTGNGNVCHYEEVDLLPAAIQNSPNITSRKKTNRTVSNSDSPTTLTRPKSKPPPPPRPPLPSNTDEENVPKVDDSRWDKGFVRVAKRNPNLTDDNFITDHNFRNPGYGKKQSIISGQIMGEEAGLKRFKSDEFLYAEIGDEGGFKLNEAIYHDPVDILPSTPGTKGHLTEHGVVVDSEGYAIPDTNHHSAGRKLQHYKKNLRRSGTIASGNRPQFLQKSSPSKSPTATAINRKRSPQVRERLSRAYSVLRKRPSFDGLESTPTSSLHCVPEDEVDSDEEVDDEVQKKRLQYVASNREAKYGTLSHYASYRPRRRSRELYSYALIVGLQQTEPDSTQQKPHVLFTHPKEAVPDNIAVIADFCFPDACIWRPVTQYTSESFSFVLTNNEGQRQYGYCRRILPPGTGNRLPEVYCVVTDLGAWSLYGQLLDDAERKRQLSMRHVEELLVAGLKATLPSPGKEAWIHCMAANHSKETLILKRSTDSRQEKVSFEPLMKKLSTENLLKVFASILLERRIIFVGQHLSTLTCCIHAAVSLLYPFSWQHTFVPILPAAMIDICCAPTPYIAGILTAAQPKLRDLEMEKVLQVDLDNNCLLDQVGDEASIIPKKLQKALTAALKDDNATDGAAGGSRDVLVFEVFLRLFVETVGHFSDYILMQQDGKDIFLREQFVKAVNSKSIGMFLEWFTETQMFDAFIIHQLNQDEQGAAELFELRIEEYRQEMADMSPSLRENFKEVGRKMLNFFIESGAKVKKALNSNNNVFV